MNVQADREALQSFLARQTSGNQYAPTGAAYIAADGTLWHQYTHKNIDDAHMWVTTRLGIHDALRTFTYRITNDMMVLEDVF